LIVSILLGCTLLNSKTGTIWDASVPVSTKGVLSHLLLVHNVTGDIAAINYPLWSIAVECQIYLIFPLLLVLWRNIGLWRLAFLCLTVAYPIVYLTRHMVVSGLNLYFVWLFVMGMLAAYSTTGRDPLLNWMRRHAPLMMIIGFVLLAGVTLILGVEGGYFAMRYGRYFDIFLGAAAFLLLVGTSNGNGVLRTMLSWKPLVTVGTFSYSLYLLHAPFVQLAWQYGASRMPISDETRFALLVFAGIPLIMLISYGFFLLFERPFLNPSSRGVARVADKGAEHLAMVQAAV
jgi:peptidoglycan/LPS O-acetylase OafA/YrhL